MTSNWKRQIPTALILLLGLGITFLLASQGEEEEVKEGRMRELPVVKVWEAQASTRQLQVPGWGVVEPLERVNMQSEISGRVVELSEKLRPGGRFKAGELLFALEARDAQYELEQAKAELEQARQALNIESGRQAIAQAEWVLLGQQTELPQASRDRALRVPQFKEHEAAVRRAQALVDQAQLRLERTRILAPDDGRILEEDIALGRYVEPGQALLTFLSTRRFRIHARFSADAVVKAAGAEVRLQSKGREWTGQVLEILPGVDPETRQRQVLVDLDPVEGLLGAYAELKLPGEQIAEGFPLPRAALRRGRHLWILSPENRLEIREVEVLGEDEEMVVIGKGLQAAERVIVSHLSTPLVGMELRAEASE